VKKEEPKQDVSPQKEEQKKSPIKAERLRQSPESNLKRKKSQLSIAAT
jgi:hypothetical protein